MTENKCVFDGTGYKCTECSVMCKFYKKVEMEVTSVDQILTDCMSYFEGKCYLIDARKEAINKI